MGFQPTTLRLEGRCADSLFGNTTGSVSPPWKAHPVAVGNVQQQVRNIRAMLTSKPRLGGLTPCRGCAMLPVPRCYPTWPRRRVFTAPRRLLYAHCTTSRSPRQNGF